MCCTKSVSQALSCRLLDDGEQSFNEIHLEDTAQADQDHLEAGPVENKRIIGLKQVLVPRLLEPHHGLRGENLHHVEADLVRRLLQKETALT